MRAVDLRFTPDEASLLLREAIGVELPAASVAALETSVLDRLSGGLCDAVTGRSDSQQQLEQLGRTNLFLVPLDDVRRWWRYHQLFADLLRQAPAGAPRPGAAAAPQRCLMRPGLLPLRGPCGAQGRVGS